MRSMHWSRPADRARTLSYAARQSSFTSTSLQEEQAKTTTPGSSLIRGTVRTGFITLPQTAQGKMGKLSGKTIALLQF
jgi:hypothetical protein